MHEKFLWILKKTRNEDNELWRRKEENDTINKGTAGIAWKDKNLLYFQKLVWTKVH